MPVDDALAIKAYLIKLAADRGATLPHRKVNAAARGLSYMQKHGIKLDINRFQDLPGGARVAARWVCGILLECKGIDPTPRLRELQRLDELDDRNPNARLRSQLSQTIFPSRSAVLSEAAWIEANGY
jgi:hypothetical protein